MPKAGKAALRAPRPGSAPRSAAAPSGMPHSADTRAAVEATVAGLGCELVDVERVPRGLLRVTIDRRPDQAYAEPGDAVTVGDCEQVTRQLQYALEVDGVEYSRLEVSSPGLDRPLRSEADFTRFAGQAVALTLKQAFGGRKHFQGQLGRAEPATPGGAAGWQLVFNDGKADQVLGFTLDEVREARLVPVVDFKGRKQAAKQARAADSAAAQEQEEVSR